MPARVRGPRTALNRARQRGAAWLLVGLGLACTAVGGQEPATVQHVARGESYAAQGQFGLAARAYEQALEAGAGSAQVLNRLAELYLQAEAPQRAVPVLLRSLQEKPGQLVVYSRLGEAFYAQGLLDSAIHYVEQARALAPDASAVRSSLGFLYLQKEDRGRARENLQAALQLDGRNPEARRYLAVYYAAGDSVTEALQQYRLLLDILPDDVPALNNTAYLLSQRKEYQQAIEYYTRAKARATDPQMAAAIAASLEAVRAVVAGKMRARYILVETQAEARQVQQRLQQGGDFAALAAELSRAPNAADGGDTGFFGPGELLPEFEKAVAGLPVGKLSGLVEVPQGVMIIQRLN